MKRNAVAPAVALGLAAVLASPNFAQQSGAEEASAATSIGKPGIEGVFLLAPEAGDRVEDVIERGVSLLSWYKRPFARGRLRETTRPAAWVSIEPDSATVRFRTEVDDMRIPWVGGLDAWEWKPGQPIDVRASRAEGALLQEFHGPDGSRYNRYTLRAGGDTLDLAVRIESDQLAEPLRYHLVYVRQ